MWTREIYIMTLRMQHLVWVFVVLVPIAWSHHSSHIITWNHTPGDAVVLVQTNAQNHNKQQDRRKRDVIEEEKYYYTDVTKDDTDSSEPWLPETIKDEEKTPDSVSITTSKSVEQALPLYITEKPTDKPGRGARMASDNWVKLPSPNRDDEEKNRLLTPPQPSEDLLNSRMPRVNFVTQNKRLDTSESSNDRESVPKAQINRKDELGTDFFYRGVDSRARNMKEVYPRQALYYAEDDRRRYLYDDRYYPEEMYRRDPYYEPYERAAVYSPYSPMPRVDRLDPTVYDSYITRKPKRIIYYAHLPEVVRSSPSVDMRYKYAADPYRRYDDDYVRGARYDPRFKPRYPYGGLKKDDRLSRDLMGSSTKEKGTQDKVLVPPAPVKKAEVPKNPYTNLNSHQYHLDSSEYRPETQPGVYPDVLRSDQNFLRYDVPSFQAPVDDPYADRQ